MYNFSCCIQHTLQNHWIGCNKVVSLNQPNVSLSYSIWCYSCCRVLKQVSRSCIAFLYHTQQLQSRWRLVWFALHDSIALFLLLCGARNQVHVKPTPAQEGCWKLQVEGSQKAGNYALKLELSEGWGGVDMGRGVGILIVREMLCGRVIDIFECNINKMWPRTVCFQHCLQLTMLINNPWTCLVYATWYCKSFHLCKCFYYHVIWLWQVCKHIIPHTHSFSLNLFDANLIFSHCHKVTDLVFIQASHYNAIHLPQ